MFRTFLIAVRARQNFAVALSSVNRKIFYWNIPRGAQYLERVHTQSLQTEYQRIPDRIVKTEHSRQRVTDNISYVELLRIVDTHR